MIDYIGLWLEAEKKARREAILLYPDKGRQDKEVYRLAIYYYKQYVTP